jgi:hypothetical protein
MFLLPQPTYPAAPDMEKYRLKLLDGNANGEEKAD